MKAISLSFVATLAFTAGPPASAETINSQPYAKDVAQQVIQACPNGPSAWARATRKEKSGCARTVRDQSYRLAADLSTYIKDRKARPQPFQAGIAQGNLLTYCELPAKRSRNSSDPDVLLKVAKRCIESTAQSSETVGITASFQASAADILANAVNCNFGHTCLFVKLDGTLSEKPDHEVKPLPGTLSL